MKHLLLFCLLAALPALSQVTLNTAYFRYDAKTRSVFFVKGDSNLELKKSGAEQLKELPTGFACTFFSFAGKHRIRFIHDKKADTWTYQETDSLFQLTGTVVADSLNKHWIPYGNWSHTLGPYFFQVRFSAGFVTGDWTDYTLAGDTWFPEKTTRYKNGTAVSTTQINRTAALLQTADLTGEWSIRRSAKTLLLFRQGSGYSQPHHGPTCTLNTNNTLTYRFLPGPSGSFSGSWSFNPETQLLKIDEKTYRIAYRSQTILYLSDDFQTDE